VELAGRAGPARRYEFTRFEGTTLRRLYVLDFFLLAGDRAIVGDMRTMERATRDPRVGALGVGQVQIIQESEDATARQRAEREILLAIGPLSAVIARETNQWTTPSPLSMTR
jgi:hypothetical protein